MKVPGEAILEFRLHSVGEDQTEIQMLSRFLPRGLLGILYWYIFFPLHQWIFKGVIRKISEASGRPLLEGPERFAPGLRHVCAVDPRKPF
jgi:hypothetical protein